MKRLVDLTGGILLALVGAVPLAALWLAVRLTSRGPALHWSDRVGRDNKIFKMPKFRTMRIDTPGVATHLLVKPTQWMTPIGDLLRRTSLDELPQLWSILAGDMSFVGPRPALHNQHDLIAARTAVGVHKLRPGLTGWAQINGRSELSIPEKVALDAYYLEHQSLGLDCKIVLITALKVLRREATVVPPKAPKPRASRLARKKRGLDRQP